MTGMGFMTGGRAAQLGSTFALRFLLQSGSTVSVLLINRFFGPQAVALYSACLAAIMLTVIVFRNGLPVLLLRYGISHSDKTIAETAVGFQATLYRSPAQYIKTALLFAALAAYIGYSMGKEAVLLLALLSPLILILPIFTLLSSQYKASGQPIRASAYEVGSVHMAIALLILASVAFGVQNFTTIFQTVFVLTLIAGLATVAHFLQKTRGVEQLRDPGAQRRILASVLLQFVYGNGFPLVFAAFVIAEDLGHFRLEERMFFLLLFFYLLLETIWMKQFIKAFQKGNERGSLGFYVRTALLLSGVGLISALAMYIALSDQWIAGAVGYERTGAMAFLMAIAVPFYFLTNFNNMVLNLSGHHTTVIWSLLLGVTIFLTSSYLVYPDSGIDGIRAAYLAGGAASSLMSCAVIFGIYHRKMRKDRD